MLAEDDPIDQEETPDRRFPRALLLLLFVPMILLLTLGPTQARTRARLSTNDPQAKSIDLQSARGLELHQQVTESMTAAITAAQAQATTASSSSSSVSPSTSSSSTASPSSTFPFAEVLTPTQALCNSLTPITVMVLTIPTHREERSFIRQYVREMTGGAVKPIFPLGEPGDASVKEVEAELEREAQEMGDIVLANFTDSYNHLPAKVLIGIKFVHDCHAPQTLFLLKVDYDVIVNWHLMYPALQDLIQKGIWASQPDHHWNATHDPLWGGHRWKNMPVIKDRASRNFEDVPFDYFPEYAAGPAYFMNMVFIHSMLTVRAKDSHVYNNEDAMIGIMASRINITPIHDPRFLVFGGDYMAEACGKEAQVISDCGCDEWLTYHAQNRSDWAPGIKTARSCAGLPAVAV